MRIVLACTVHATDQNVTSLARELFKSTAEETNDSSILNYNIDQYETVYLYSIINYRTF